MTIKNYFKIDFHSPKISDNDKIKEKLKSDMKLKISQCNESCGVADIMDYCLREEKT